MCLCFRIWKNSGFSWHGSYYLRIEITILKFYISLSLPISVPTCIARVSSHCKPISITLTSNTDCTVLCNFSNSLPVRQYNFQFVVSAGCYVVQGFNPWKARCNTLYWFILDCFKNDPNVCTIIIVWVRLAVLMSVHPSICPLPVSENAHYVWTILHILIKFYILIIVNHVWPLAFVTAFLMDESLINISRTGRGQLVKMFITLVPHGIFW